MPLPQDISPLNSELMDSLTKTREFAMTQTMLRIKDPAVSVPFYQNVLGMTLLNQFDFPEMKFSLYFLGFLRDRDIPADPVERAAFTFRQLGAIELTHNWGTENDEAFGGYHDGNSAPQGFGHIGITVPDVYEACRWFDENGVEFVKRPDDGKMKGLAFIKDPDGYWIDILSANGLAKLVGNK